MKTAVEQDIFVIFQPGEFAEGVVRIGNTYYTVTPVAQDEYEFTKDDGTTYHVSCWSTRPGGFLCECKDWLYRSLRGTRPCQHIRAAMRLKRQDV